MTLSTLKKIFIFFRTNTNIKIRVGDWDTSRAVEPFPFQEVLVAQIRIHPNYVNATNPNLQNNVAILRLSQPIVFNSPAINSLCLPLQTQIFDNQRFVIKYFQNSYFTKKKVIIYFYKTFFL